MGRPHCSRIGGGRKEEAGVTDRSHSSSFILKLIAIFS
jgi:hypothetical protein